MSETDKSVKVSLDPGARPKSKEILDEKDKVIAIKEIVQDEKPIGDPEYSMKHPLQNKWALWFFKNDRQKKWEDNLRLVTKFDTVEDFWALYNHIQLSSKLQSGCDYNLFKDGIQPMWEDKANKKGGKWMLQMNKQQRVNELDKIWLEILLCLIGEGFGEDSDYVNGGVVQVRHKGDKAAIWTSDYKNRDGILNIGHIFRSRLALPKKIILGFQAHEDTMSKSGSTVKNMWTV